MKYKIANLEITEEQLNELIKQRDKVKSGRFRPKADEIYFYADRFGTVGVRTNDGTSFVRWKISQNNCFKSEEEATDHKNYLIAVAEVNQAIEEINDGWKPDWSNQDQSKYVLSFNYIVGAWDWTVKRSQYGFSLLNNISNPDRSVAIIETQKENLDIIQKYHN